MLKTFPPVCVCVCAWHEICHTLKVVTGVLYEKKYLFFALAVFDKCKVSLHGCEPYVQPSNSADNDTDNTHY